MIATSVGASATGSGGNFLICDDLINPDQANSDAVRFGSLRWFDEVFSTRLDDKRNGRIVVIEQRTHVEDLTGHLVPELGWYHISLPAKAEARTTVVFPVSGRKIEREPGDILWPDREGPAELEAAKRRLGSFTFQSQYQQAPVAREGNLIKAEWLGATYRQIPTRFDCLIMSLDTAFKTGTTNDYSALVAIGTLGTPRDGSPPGHYLLDAWRGRVEFADLKRRVAEFCQTWRPQALLIEDAASGQSLIQELQRGTSLPLKPVRADRDKLACVAAITPTLEARRLLLPESAWWRDELIAELISFPAGLHDDWVDALAQALLYLASRQNGPSREDLAIYACASAGVPCSQARFLLSAGEAPHESETARLARAVPGLPQRALERFTGRQMSPEELKRVVEEERLRFK